MANLRIKKLKGLQKNISLAKYTTFKIGGKAKYFFIAKTKDDLIKAVEAALLANLPFFILGAGSNILVSDEGYKGLAIKIKSQKLKVKNYDSQIKIMSEAGVMLKDLVSESARQGFTGFEWAAGIPGSIGGALRGNAGAFEESMADSVKSVEVLEIRNKKIKIKNFSKKDCKFKYRDSIFKQKRNFTLLNASKGQFRQGRNYLTGLIILSVVLQFKKGDKKKIKNKIKKNLNYRKKRHPLNFLSAGSVFKNPTPSPLFGQKEGMGRGKLGQISAAELIDKAGLRGKKIGQAQVSKKHCNFIINLGRAKAKEVKKLIDLIKTEVRKKFRIKLEEEIEILSDSERF